MKKYFDILLISLLLLFTFQYFTGKDNSQNTQTPSGIEITTDARKYKVPAGIFLDIKNNTSEILTFDSCTDLQVFYNGTLKALPEGFCSEVRLAASESATIDYSKIYDDFSQP